MSANGSQIDKPAYPVLALFLAFATNDDFPNMKDDDIAYALKVNSNQVAVTRKLLGSAEMRNIEDVRAQFQTLAMALKYSGGGQCPGTTETLGAITNLGS